MRRSNHRKSARRVRRKRIETRPFPTSGIERLEERRLLTSVFELSTLLTANGGDGSSGFALNGVDIWDMSGWSASSAGDINGDGFEDVAIGAAYANPGGPYSYEGQVYVVFGKAGGFTAELDLATLDGTNGFTITGAAAYDYAGYSLDSIGDFNGDGFDDLLLNASDWYSGKSYIIYGKSTFAADFNLASIDGTNGSKITSSDPNDYLGWENSAAGDINGDGFDDVALAWSYADPNGVNNSGITRIIYGKAGGLGANFDIDTLDGTNGFAITGANASESSGFAISAGGDVNGDGFDDFLLSASHVVQDDGTIRAGRSYVIFGNPNGFAAELNLSELNGTNGFGLDGIDAFDSSGYWLSDAGDVNGDGYDDIMIGARYGDPNGVSNAGEAYVVFGKASGWPATFDLATLDGTNGFTINGANENDYLGRYVGGGGDFNGDGYDDVLLSSYSIDVNGTNSGAAYIIYGSGGGFAQSINVSDLDGTNGFAMYGVAMGNYAGEVVEFVGDMNGDGYDDILIGAAGVDIGADLMAGQSYVIFGGDFTSVATLSGDANANTLNGTGADDVIVGAQGDDTIVGGGGSDVLLGGEGDDSISVATTNFLRIDGGNGYDVLTFTGGGQTLDMTNSSSTSVQSIEALDITGSGANTLVMELGDVLSISEDTNTIIITGDGDDTLDLDAGWTFSNFETINGTLFNVLTNGEATIKVADAVFLTVNDVSITAVTSAATDVTPTIVWQMDVGAASYDIRFINVATNQQVVYATGITGTTYTSATNLPAGTYLAYVRAVDANSVAGGWGTPLNVSITPPGSTTLSGPGSSTVDTTPTLSWLTVTDAVTYDLLVYSIQAGQQVIGETGLAGASFTTSVDLSEGNYVAFARAVNATGDAGGWSVAEFFGIVAPGSATFTSPTSTTTDTTPTFSWNAVSGAAQYELLVYNTGIGQQVIHVSNVSGTSFTSGNTLAHGNYSAYVRAVNGAGDTGNWGAVSFSIAPPDAPTVTGPSSNITDNTPTIAWNAVADAARYELMVYNLQQGQQVINDSNVAGTSYTSPGNLSAGTYLTYVRAVTADDDAGGWTAHQFTISAPGVPTVTSPGTVTSDTTPTFNWNAVADAANYELQVYDITTGQRVVLETTLAGTSFTVASALSSSTYQAYMRATNATGDSGQWTALEFSITQNSPDDGDLFDSSLDDPADDALDVGAELNAETLVAQIDGDSAFENNDSDAAAHELSLEESNAQPPATDEGPAPDGSAAAVLARAVESDSEAMRQLDDLFIESPPVEV